MSTLGRPSLYGQVSLLWPTFPFLQMPHTSACRASTRAHECGQRRQQWHVGECLFHQAVVRSQPYPPSQPSLPPPPAGNDQLLTIASKTQDQEREHVGAGSRERLTCNR